MVKIMKPALLLVGAGLLIAGIVFDSSTLVVSGVILVVVGIFVMKLVRRR